MKKSMPAAESVTKWKIVAASSVVRRQIREWASPRP
jgi:hypothetical protein